VSLRAQLLLLLLVVGMVPLGIASYRLIDLNSREMTVRIQEGHLELARGFSDRIENKLLTATKQIVGAVHSEEFEARTLTQKKAYLVWVMKQYEEINAITLVSKSGQMHQSYDLTSRTLPEIEAHLERIPYRKALAQRTVLYSEVFSASAEGANRVNIIVPTPEGSYVVAAELGLDRLQADSENQVVGKTGRSYIVDREGRLVAHPDRARASARERISRPGLRGLLLKTKRGSTAFDLDGGRVLASFASVPGIGWSVVVEQPEAEAFETTRRMTRTSLGVALVCGALALLIGIWMAGGIARPMIRLAAGAMELGRGNLGHRVPEVAGGEIGVLTRTFNQMGASLEDRNLKLAQLNQISHELSRINDDQELLDHGARTLAQIFPQASAGMALFDEHHLAPRMGPPLCEPAEARIAPGDALLEAVGSTGEGIFINDWPDTPGSVGNGVRLFPTAQHLLCVPLGVHDRQTGLIYLVADRDAPPFEASHLEFVQVIAAGMAVSLENIRLTGEMVDKVRMQEELKLAEATQQTLLSLRELDLPDLQVISHIEPASETGGDYLSLIEDPERNRVALLIGDVTGHGAPAALLTAATNGYVRHLESLVQEESQLDWLSPSRSLTQLNRIIHASAKGRLLMTFFAGVYDCASRRLRFANAGHPLPLLLRPVQKSPTGKLPRQQIKVLKAIGPILGDEQQPQYEEREVYLRSGDTLVWHTDGVPECRNHKGKIYSQRKLERLLRKNATADPQTLRSVVLDDLDKFRQGAPLADDLTLSLSQVPFDQGRLGQLLETLEPAQRHCTVLLRPNRMRDELMSLLTDIGLLPEAVNPDEVDDLSTMLDDERVLFVDAQLATACPEDFSGPGSDRVIMLAFLPLTAEDLALTLGSGFPKQLVAYNSAYHTGDLLSCIEGALGEARFGIEHAFQGRGVGIKMPLSSKHDLEQARIQLVEFCQDIGIKRFWLHAVELILVELGTNALDYAMSDDSTQPPRFNCVYDGDRGDLHLSVADPAGAHAWPKVVGSLLRRQRGTDLPPVEGHKGAGVGFLRVLEHAHALRIVVDPGKRTEVHVRIHPAGSRKKLIQSNRSVSFFAAKG